MKNSLLLAVGLAAAVFLSTGCKTNERVTKLPDGTAGQSANPAGGKRAEQNLDTNPLGQNGNPTGTSPVTGTTLPNAALPDDSKLEGRTHDRTIFAGETVYFDFDRSNVKPNEAGKIEKVIAGFKAKGAGHDLLIEGHCDERGTEEYNRSLGERRALAIRELLMKSGLDGSHIFTRTFGKDKPADPGHNEAAWEKNRRGEFILVLPK